MITPQKGNVQNLTENCVELIKMEEFETTIKALIAKKKSPGPSRINNELYEHVL